MLFDDFLAHLRSMPGVLRAEPLDRDTVQRVMACEESIKRVSGGMRLENVGIGTCAARDDVFAVFCGSGFPRPTTVIMELVDDRGVVVGHDVPYTMMELYETRSDVIWFTDSFVMYPDKMEPCDARMVMKASRLEAEFPDGVEPWVFYPSPSSADMVNARFGLCDSRMSTIILGVDGLERGPQPSVPVPDVVEVPGAGRGHGEPSPEHTLYRRDLVRERLQVPELALADEDLHALVVVQVDVHGRVDEGLVLVLQVGQLVPDRGHRVVVDHDDGPDHPLLVVLPLGLGERVAHQVPDGLGPAHVAFLGYRFVESPEELGLQGHAYAGHAFHGRAMAERAFNTLRYESAYVMCAEGRPGPPPRPCSGGRPGRGARRGATTFLIVASEYSRACLWNSRIWRGPSFRP